VTVIQAERPVHCVRDGGVFKLAFRYDPALVARVKALPYASFDPQTKAWSTTVCVQSLDTLRGWRWEGLLDVDPDTLIHPGEVLEKVPGAVLAPGTTRRPFIVRTAMRDEQLYSRLMAISGARWEKAAGGVSYPPHASMALAELADRKILDDPQRLLQPAAVVVGFNANTGAFGVRGDERAANSFAKNFPKTDVMAAWVEKGLDVAFADDFTKEMYRGELARVGGGIQPEGMQIALYPYQQVDLAVILERSGVGVFSAMGVGKCLRGDTRVLANGSLVPIEELWRDYASLSQRSYAHGGEWAALNSPIHVKSLDGETFVEARASRLFRQRVRETLRQVVIDGQTLVLTRAHKLRLMHGWSNEYQIGDLVAVSHGPTATYEPISEITDVEHDGYVFDLEVAQLHNFVAEGIVCHNTALGIAAGHELMTNRNDVPRVVVVVPPAVRTQWREEILRFTGCSPDDVVIVDGDKKKRMAAYDAMDAGAKWLIVHYQAVILPDDKKRLEKLTAGALLIADECHRVKNKDAKTSKVVWALGKIAARRIGLSGTPVENSPGEWFNILSGFLVPGVFGSPLEFLNRYSYPGKFAGFEGARNIPELKNRSKPLYVRHTLSEIATHLPPLRVQTLPLDPKPEYATALKRAHREARDEIKRKRLEQHDKHNKNGVLDGQERDEIEAGAEMTAVGLLKLMCCSPRLVALSEAPSAEAMRESGLIPEEDGPKLDELRVMCAEIQAANDRVVVFTSSKRMAYLVAERMEQDGIRHVLYTGDSTTAERDAAVKAFTNVSEDEAANPTVFIATDAGAEGLNLGRHCSTLVNLDIPWTPGRLAQRNARVRRVDSTASGFLVVNLVVRGTLEEGILRMVEHKADLADAVFGESGGRKATTGRGGRNIFETALEAWSE
jgi:superfamily II DNA or RNA helicase